ncbi:hypothetical protein [Leifsonia soli]|uniref:Catechol-2,3-dioxygenase n=1 Tax=Leifsonia soli TaxID=582665 RepID=A0A852T374_9MICO|nr:hypothetical protein [Leifsonia soli]NYD76096.1 catechol-2,3-dioxygenase [Leifsonia soli]
MLTVEQRGLLIAKFEAAQAAARIFARGWQGLGEHPLDAAFRLHVEDIEAARGFYEHLNTFTDWGQHSLASAGEKHLLAQTTTSTETIPHSGPTA